jgi:hypothetical protein
MRFFLFLALFSSSAMAYVPTVESLFRHGSNPEVTTNAVAFNMIVKRVQGSGKEAPEASSLKSDRAEDYYKIYLAKNGPDSFKVSQARFKDSGFAETSIEQKSYYSNLSAYTFKPTTEDLEKGLFFALLHSLAMNNGSHVVNYLKTLDVPVKLNNELINREKIAYLASYKTYLSAVNKDRRTTMANPLRPEDPAAKDKVDTVMNEPMYTDTNQVKLWREDGEMAWLVSAGNFESVISFKDRDVQKFKYKSAAGDFEVSCKEYWLANGVHLFPRFMFVKSLSGDLYQIELTNLRHYSEKEAELVKRLSKWDQLLRGKASTDPRPEFLL